MKNLLANPEPAAARWHALASDFAGDEGRPQPLAPARWDRSVVKSVLVVRLRSIGDTVLATSALDALRRFLPQARIDLLLESWVAPVLEGLPSVHNTLT